jgi:hypothetical protein
MGLRIAEIGEQPVAVKMRYETAGPVDDLGAGMVKGSKFCQRLFRIQLARRRREVEDAAGQNSLLDDAPGAHAAHA